MLTLVATYTLKTTNETVTLTIKERDGYYALVVVGPKGSTTEPNFTPSPIAAVTT